MILDEFQRFKDLLDADDDGAELANAIFDHPDAKVLLLSATPYKMYTLPDEPEGDDHYRDFTRTVRFLAGDERAHIVERELRAHAAEPADGRGPARAQEARDRVERELRRVMSRTERLSSTPDRDGMLVERPLPGAEAAAEICGPGARSTTSPARSIVTMSSSTGVRRPYPLNLMDRNSYQVRTKFQAAAERNDPALAALLRERPRAPRLGRHPALPAGRSRQRQAARTGRGRARPRRMAAGLAAAVAAVLRDWPARTPSPQLRASPSG